MRYLLIVLVASLLDGCGFAGVEGERYQVVPVPMGANGFRPLIVPADGLSLIPPNHTVTKVEDQVYQFLRGALYACMYKGVELWLSTGMDPEPAGMLAAQSCRGFPVEVFQGTDPFPEYLPDEETPSASEMLEDAGIQVEIG